MNVFYAGSVAMLHAISGLPPHDGDSPVIKIFALGGRTYWALHPRHLRKAS